MWAEYQTYLGYRSRVIETRINYLKKAQSVYPFDYVYRIGPSIELSKLAINNNNVFFGKLALQELKAILKHDKYSPELLAPDAIMNYGVGNVKEAKNSYLLFKQTAKKSNYLDFMKGYFK